MQWDVPRKVETIFGGRIEKQSFARTSFETNRIAGVIGAALFVLLLLLIVRLIVANA